MRVPAVVLYLVVPRALRVGIHTEDVHSSRIVRVFGDRANGAFLSQNVGYEVYTPYVIIQRKTEEDTSCKRACKR